MWYLNPKNILLMIMAVLLIGLTTMYLLHRNTIIKLEGQNQQLVSDNLVKTAIIQDQEKNLKAIGEHQKRVQVIEKNTHTVREIIREIKPDIQLGGCNNATSEEKQKIQDAVAAAITLFATGMYSKTGDNSSTKESMPTSNRTDLDNADKGTPENP